MKVSIKCVQTPPLVIPILRRKFYKPFVLVFGLLFAVCSLFLSTDSVSAYQGASSVSDPMLNGRTYAYSKNAGYNTFLRTDVESGGSANPVYNICWFLSGISSFKKQYYNFTFYSSGVDVIPATHMGQAQNYQFPVTNQVLDVNSSFSLNSGSSDGYYNNYPDSFGQNFYFNGLRTYNVTGILDGTDTTSGYSRFCFGSYISTGNASILLLNPTSREFSISGGPVTLYDDLDSARNDYLKDIRDSLNNDDAQRQQDEQRLNNTQNQTNDSADSSSEEAETSGTTLLAGFQSFVGALSNASPGSCSIRMDLGNIDLGNADLCSLSPPSSFQVIGSIVLIGFCVPLSLATARKMISLFRSFQ